VTYITAPAEKGNLVTTINATGTVRAVFSIKVGSQLSGQVLQLFADFNDTVKQG
jgi:multidrug efflux pump subunit AcrA (membrane-fusion protein)